MIEKSREEIDKHAFRQTCGRFATGITIITTEVNGQIHGMTANAFLSVSLDPPLILISVANYARMYNLLQKGSRYAVSILHTDQKHLSNHFAGQPSDLQEIQFESRCNHPVIPDALAWFVADVVAIHEAGDHTLFVGAVQYLAYKEWDPLLFYSGSYRTLDSVDN